MSEKCASATAIDVPPSPCSHILSLSHTHTHTHSHSLTHTLTHTPSMSRPPLAACVASIFEVAGISQTNAFGVEASGFSPPLAACKLSAFGLKLLKQPPFNPQPLESCREDPLNQVPQPSYVWEIACRGSDFHARPFGGACSVVLGAIVSFLEPLWGHLSPKIDMVS